MSTSALSWLTTFLGEDDHDEGFAPKDLIPLSKTIPWGPFENVGSPCVTPFPFDPTLSVRTYVGEILAVSSDACVVFESPDCDRHDIFDEARRQEMGGRLRAMGGSTYRQELRHIMQPPLRSGEARASKVPPHLPMDYVIHTVGPKFKQKYSSSAQNTLSTCIRECFDLCLEHKCRSVTIPMIYSKTKDFPLDLMVHTVLRTTRRWLERLDVDTLVFVGSQEDLNLYNDLLPVYFPRSHEEASIMLPYITQLDIGNQFGELSDADRTIRIDGHFGSDDKDGSDLDVSFLHDCEAEFDNARRQKLLTTAWDCANAEEVTCVYRRYLRESDKYDFDELIQRGFLLFEESNGRKVVTLIGSLFPARVDPKILLLFIISYLDPKIKDRYSLLYIHTNVLLSQNAPSWALFSELMRIFTTRFAPTLDMVVILHPDLVFKAMFSVAALCIARTLWPGAHYADRVYDLERLLGRVGLPDFVLAYDRNL